MTPEPPPPRDTNRGAFAFAFAWMMALGITLSMAPVIGPFITGVVGGRRSRQIGTAFAASVVPALFIGGIAAAAAKSGVTVAKNQTVSVPATLIAVQLLALYGGVFTGLIGRATKLVGLGMFIAALVLFRQQVWPVVSLYRSTQTAASSVPANTTAAATCPDNLQKLYHAAMTYADDYDGMLPPADRWMTALTGPPEPTLPDAGALHDPALGGNAAQYGYAMNAALGGERMKDVKETATTPLFYDSSTLALDAHDGVTSLPSPGRHAGKNNLVYLDGHVGQR